jgi:hypothetical protein
VSSLIANIARCAATARKFHLQNTATYHPQRRMSTYICYCFSSESQGLTALLCRVSNRRLANIVLCPSPLFDTNRDHRFEQQVELSPSGSLLLACNHLGEVNLWPTATGGAPVHCVTVGKSLPLRCMTVMESHGCMLHVWVLDTESRVHHLETGFLCSCL